MLAQRRNGGPALHQLWANASCYHSVADPGIDKRGAPLFAKIYTHHSWHSYDSYALEGSGGMLPRKILKSKASNKGKAVGL